MITPIYCAAGNPRFAEIAVTAGFAYGAQLPGSVYGELYFADQNFKRPNRAAYMRGLALHRPYLASVLDWERPEQLPEVLAWAEEAAAYVEVVLLVPKVVGGIASLPRVIGGKPVRLGYSVKTRYGGTDVPLAEFSGWPVHLLGGSPQRQMQLAGWPRQQIIESPHQQADFARQLKLVRCLDVQSIDCNYHQLMATSFNQFWVPGNAYYARDHWWPRLAEAGDYRDEDAPYEAFKRSCQNIIASWQRFGRESVAA